MAEEKQTVILDFQVEQGDALKELESTKKAILQLKQEQKELNDEYKKTGNLDAFVKGQVRLEAALKSQTAAYNNLQRQVTGLKSPFAQLSDQIKDQAKQVTIAGVSLSTFANPVTATVGVLAALGKAYASTTTGAKDLEFATSQLSIRFGLIGEQLSRLVSGGDEGEGALSKMVAFFTRAEGNLLKFYNRLGITAFGTENLGEKAEVLAKQLQKLDELQRDEASVKAANAARQEENAELKTQIENTNSYSEKLRLQDQIIENLKTSQEELNKVKRQEVKINEDIFAADDRNEEKEKKAKEAQAEAARESARAERLIQAAIRERQKLEDARRDAGFKVPKRDAAEKAVEAINITGDVFKETTPRIDLAANATDSLTRSLAGLTAQTLALSGVKKEKNKLDEKEIENLLVLSNTAGVLLQAFQENTVAYKLIAITKATIDTYLGAAAMLGSGLLPPFNFIAAGAVIAAGLDAVSKIATAAGGGEFETKGPTLLLVGDNPGGRERVEVTPISGKGKTRIAGNMVAAAGGINMIADGGVSKDALTGNSAQRFSMPAITVVNVWRDFVDFRDKKDVQAQWVER